jgi:hypothetical protein
MERRHWLERVVRRLAASRRTDGKSCRKEGLAEVMCLVRRIAATQIVKWEVVEQTAKALAGHPITKLKRLFQTAQYQ